MEGERIARLEEQVKDIRDDVREIKKDTRQLLEFKWRIYGATAVIAFSITGIVELAIKIVEAKP